MTFNHPFRVKGKGWTFAKDLRVGDELETEEGQSLSIEAIELKQEMTIVYNMTVDEFHTYFVSNLGVWVHNTNKSGECGVSFVGKETVKTNPNGIFENAPYHGKANNSVKNKAQNNGQAALDHSVPLNSETTPRRIGVSDGEIVILDETTDGVFHGYVRSWSELNPKMRSVLQKAGLVDRKGNVIKK